MGLSRCLVVPVSSRAAHLHPHAMQTPPRQAARDQVRRCILLGICLLAAVPVRTVSSLPVSTPGVTRKARGHSSTTRTLAWRDTLMRLPLLFEPNRGQAPAPAQFIARGQGATF